MIWRFGLTGKYWENISLNLYIFFRSCFSQNWLLIPTGIFISFFFSCWHLFFQNYLTCLSLYVNFSFEFRLRVALGPGGDLLLTSRIRNTSTDGKPFTFTFAYHTYFSVSDIRWLTTLVYLFTLSGSSLVIMILWDCLS